MFGLGILLGLLESQEIFLDLIFALLLKDFSYSRPETTLKRNWFVIPKLPFYLIFCVRAYSPRGPDYLGAWNRLGH